MIYFLIWAMVGLLSLPLTLKAFKHDFKRVLLWQAIAWGLFHIFLGPFSAIWGVAIYLTVLGVPNTGFLSFLNKKVM